MHQIKIIRMFSDKITKHLNLIGQPIEITREVLLESLKCGTGNFGKRSNMLYSLKLSALSLIKYNKSIGYKDGTAGFLYAITNPAWPGKVKLGLSTQPHKRLAQYQTYSPLRDYKMYHWSFWLDVRKAEKSFHGLLNADHEWVTLDQSLISLLTSLNDESLKQFMVP